MLEKIFRYSIEGKIVRKFISWLDKKISAISVWIYSRLTKIDDRKIFFITTRGDFDCNPKRIALRLIEKNKDFNLVWSIRNDTNIQLNDFPQQLKLVRRKSFEYYKELSSSKIIIDNSVSLVYNGYKKKKSQILIETWHGSLGIKKFSPDTVKDKMWVKKALQEAKMTDYCISNSDFENAVYREDYWKNTPILMMGHARNDILFEINRDKAAQAKEKIYGMYGLDSDTKICLYAPTFRDDGDMSPYMIDYRQLKDAMEYRFGGKWIVAVRFHYKIRKIAKRHMMGTGTVDMTDYPDIQDILACIQVGITDYSSWICEYIHTGRPGFIFATDIGEYQQTDRELFYPLESLPYPVASDNQCLIENIRNFDRDKFSMDRLEFLQDKGCVDDGMAATRTADKIEELINRRR